VSDLTDRLSKAIETGDSQEAENLTRGLLEQGEAAKAIIDNILIPAITRVGEDFANDKIFVPEMLIAAYAMNAALDCLEPHLTEGDKTARVKFVLGSVEGDLHDIGKNLVGMMLKGAGLEIIDLGVDIAPHAFVKAIQDHKAPLVGISALLTTTMPNLQKTIEVIKGSGLRDQVKIIVGGAPVTADYAAKIGADAYAPDAGSAVEVVKKLMQ
jgi:5-methyltetrahydrofolate--homocysteine methyltransferase